jgi:hypothetical protein
MVVVVELGADRLRDLGKECLVVWLVAPRLPNWRNVLAVENKMASAAGPMPGDFSECRLAGDELVNALPLVRLAVEVDDIKLARRANADVVATLRLEELRDVALLGVVVPPCLDGRLFAGIGFFRPGAVYRINVELEFVAIEPERLGHRELVKRYRDNTRHG